MKAILSALVTVLGWVVGLFMIVGGVAAFDKSGPATLVISLGGLLLLPPIFQKVSRVFGGRRWPALVLALSLIVIVGPIAMSVSQPTEAERVARQELEEAQRAEDAETEARRAEERRLAAAEREKRRAEEDARKAEQKRIRNCSDRSMAYIMSRHFVERGLLAPSTAKFPSFNSEGVRVAQISPCKFQVVAYVDAQNGFGAMIRSMYMIDMEYLPDSDSWRGTNLQM